MKVVFVYGTLKKNQSNHRLLNNAKFIGEATTIDKFVLVDFGSFPTLAKPEKNMTGYSIHGEVYELNNFDRLDQLEGFYKVDHPDNYYNRDIYQIKCNNETISAWIYMRNSTLAEIVKNSKYKHIPSGNWNYPNQGEKIDI